MKAPNQTTIAFMGTPEFARVILEALHKHGFNIVAVYAQPDKPAGRGKKLTSPPVACYAKEKGLTLKQPETLKDDLVIKDIEALSPDFIIAAAYGKFLPSTILQAAKIDSLNVHASLLPKYRGAAPINYSLMAGDQTTGVSIMRMVKEMDAGPVFLTREISIQKEDNAMTLTEKLSNLGGQALVDAIQKILEPGVKPTEQNHEQATFAPKLTRDHSQINWNKPATTIFNQIRALLPWPIATTTLNQEPLKIYASTPLETNSNTKPGTLIGLSKNGWVVATGEKDLLITQVQLQGKKRMPAFDLANGLRLEAKKTVLGT